MKTLKYILPLIILFISQNFFAQIKIDKIEPPDWWIGMERDTVQLMIYGKNLLNAEVEIENGIELLKTYAVNNPNYLFIDIFIPQNAEAKKYRLTLTNNYGNADFLFPVYEREKRENGFAGFSNEDVIYLLMPDRFANGDATNDKIPGYIDKFEGNPSEGRHGGDLKGVGEKLSYLKNLGVTTLWLTPVVENNTFRSYHGYAATDFYGVDPRLGTNKDYKRLVSEAHQLGLKVILDHVSNHISDDHPWMKNLPTKTWINGTVRNHKSAVHHKMVFTDPHRDSATVADVTEGWFVDTMPDLNQRDSFVSNYIIQNAIWWVEYAGLDGIREDTYPYVYQPFEHKLASELLREYPTMNIVGEIWTGETAFLAGYQRGKKLHPAYDTHLPTVTDFALRDAFYSFLQGGSVFQIYDVFAKDYLYENPNNLLTFIDNHDIERAMFISRKNTAQTKLAYLLLLTTRGIPQILYGSEIGIVGTQHHGELRATFPGGFPNDNRNAFTPEGRTDFENDIFNFLKKLLTLRKSHPALATGKLTHFPPENEIYVYLKEKGDEKIVVVINNNSFAKNVELTKFIDLKETVLFDLFNERPVKLYNGNILKLKKKDFVILRISE